MRKRTRRFAIVLIAAHLVGFALYGVFGWRGGRVSRAEARRLVERYNQAVSEAYRRADVNLIDPVVGPNTTEGKRLTGLIGVRLDMGITLDAELLSLEVTEVAQKGGELQVRTQERWRYRDRKIGTGEQVGEESADSYELLYTFEKSGGQWLASETSFTATPQVGRKAVPWAAERRSVHGVIAPPKGEEGKGHEPVRP